MITDIISILIAFALGYITFLLSAFFISKWMLPEITDERDLIIPGSTEKHIRHTVKNGRILAK